MGKVKDIMRHRSTIHDIRDRVFFRRAHERSGKCALFDVRQQVDGKHFNEKKEGDSVSSKGQTSYLPYIWFSNEESL